MTPSPPAANPPPGPPPPPAPPGPPAAPAGPPGLAKSGWQRFTGGALALFHAYANWLVSISWKRFFVLSILLLIASAILQEVPPFNLPIVSIQHDPGPVPPPPPPAPPPPRPPRAGADEDVVRIERKKPGGDVTIAINRDGVRITPRDRAASDPAGAASSVPASPGETASSASPPPTSASAPALPSVEIRTGDATPFR